MFDDEDEAFDAAEGVYREFTDYLNQVDISDPSTFEPLFRLSSGTFRESDRKAYSAMHADGYTVSGETKIISFVRVISDRPYTIAVADVCLDVSSVQVVNAEGTSVVSPDRPDFSAIRVTFQADRDGRMLIDSAERRGDPTCHAS